MYLQKNHHDAEDKLHCFVIDIEQQFFRKNITPEQYAAELIKSILPHSIHDLYLLTSEIEQNHFMAVFAHQLSQALLELHHRKINVHIPTYLSCEMTLIVPAKENDPWKIYGINHSNLNQTDLSYEKILAEKDKEIIWEGNDILEWMNNPQQTYNGSAYVWENQQ